MLFMKSSTVFVFWDVDAKEKEDVDVAVRVVNIFHFVHFLRNKEPYIFFATFFSLNFSRFSF